MPQAIKQQNPLPPSNPDEDTDRAIEEFKAALIKSGRPELVGKLDALCDKTERNLWKQGVSHPGLGTKSTKKFVLVANFQPVRIVLLFLLPLLLLLSLSLSLSLLLTKFVLLS